MEESAFKITGYSRSYIQNLGKIIFPLDMAQVTTLGSQDQLGGPLC